MACSVAASYDHCRQIARSTARNFYYSFLTLPRDPRRAMCALYAFMRVTDDLGDSDEPQAVRATQLKQWRASLLHACATDVTGGRGFTSGGRGSCRAEDADQSLACGSAGASPSQAQAADEPPPADHPVLPALADTIHRYKLPVQYLLDVI